MGVFDRATATALRLIKKNGQSVVWRSNFDGSPIDSLKPWNKSDVTPTDNNTVIVFLPIGARVERSTQRTQESDNVFTGYQYGYMGKVSFPISIKDVVIRNGIELRIKSIDTLSPNGEQILHEIEFEG
jgi:hypothetical protein